MRFQHHRRRDSFSTACKGFWWVLTTQPNFKIILACAVLVTSAGYYFELDQTEWIAIIGAIFSVIICELINSSIEAVVDLVTDEWKFDAKIAKDVGGAVALAGVFFAICIGFLVFLPKLLVLI